MFINELYTLLSQNNTRGKQLFPDTCTIEIFVLMFADDIAQLADTIVGLEKQLNVLKTFCTTSKLTEKNS